MDAETLGAALALAKNNSADPSVIEEKVSAWLEDHPEATTTVQDGSITYSKLHSDLQDVIDEVLSLGLSVVDGKICITYEEATA